MKKIYLRIHYGCDDRFKLVSRTIRVSAPYFHQIRITNFGPDKNTEKFSNLLKEFPNLEIVNLGKYYNMNITEDLLRYNFMDIPDGDWGAFLDSDWRFPPYFLEHMQEEIEICEQQGKNHLFSYQIAHYKPNDIELTEGRLEELYKLWEENPNSYGFPILQKIDKKNIWTDGFIGNHSYILHVPYNKRPVPKMYHLHMRDYTDHGYCSSMIHQSWWYIGHNVFQKSEQDGIVNSWEYNELERFKHIHRCYTSNEFHEMKKDPVFMDKLKQLFLKFEHSQIFSCQQMYRMATKYNMVFLDNDPTELPCEGPCCNYKCGKIKDLSI